MISTEVDPGAGLVIHRASGELSIKEIEEALEIRLHDPSYRQGMKVLWDCRAANLSTFATDQIDALITYNVQLQDARGGGMSAILVSRDVDFGVGRMFQTYAQHLPWQTSVFRDLESAITWLSGSDCGVGVEVAMSEYEDARVAFNREEAGQIRTLLSTPHGRAACPLCGATLIMAGPLETREGKRSMFEVTCRTCHRSLLINEVPWSLLVKDKG